MMFLFSEFKRRNVFKVAAVYVIVGWIIGLLLLALGFFAFDKFVLDPERDAHRVETAVEAAQQQPEVEPDRQSDASIAVLAFSYKGKDFRLNQIARELDVARRVVVSLKATLSPTADQRISKQPTEDLAA